MLLHVGTSLEQTYTINLYWYICVLNIDMYRILSRLIKVMEGVLICSQR